MSFLVRPRSDASTVAQLILDTYGGAASSAGIRVTPDRALQVSAVYSCVLVLAQSVAQLPVHLYRRQGRAKEQITEHYLVPLMQGQPNEWMTAYEFKQLAMFHLLLRGNSYWLKSRGTNGRIRELLPIHPDRVVGIDQDPAYRIFYKVKRSEDQTDTIPASAILHLKGLSQDGLRGLSPLENAREMLGLTIAAEEHGSTLFKQGARLGGILSHPGKLSKEAADRLQESFDAKYSSVANAHKTAGLGEGVKWEKIGVTAEDSQFLETRQFQREQIAGFFRVPASFINDLTRATFSNVEHLALQFVVHTLMPWLVNLEQCFQRDLLTDPEKLDHYFRFNVDGLLRGDITSRAQAMNTAINGGWLNPNEARELEDRNPYEGGDNFRMPVNVQPAGNGGTSP